MHKFVGGCDQANNQSIRLSCLVVSCRVASFVLSLVNGVCVEAINHHHQIA